MFDLIARLVLRRGWVLVALWLAVTAGLYTFAPAWDQISRDDNVRFFPPDYPSVIGQVLQERGFPRDAASSAIVLIHERRDGKLTPADFAHVEKVALDVMRIAEPDPAFGLKKIETHRSLLIGPRLIGTSKDGKGQAVVTIVSLNGTYLSKAAKRAVEHTRKFLANQPPGPPGLTMTMTGSAVVGHDLNTAGSQSIHNTTTTTIALVVVILLVVYRSPLLAFTPLLTIALSVFASMRAIALLTRMPGIQFQVIDITKVFVVVVLFGAGTDYCLFLIARYREELIRGRSQTEALREAICQVGGALVASAGTVIVGLGMLCFVSFAKIRYTGPAIAMCLAVSLVASLTIAPVLLHWLRDAIFWPFRRPEHVKGADIEQESMEQMPLSHFWDGVANLVVARPGLILSLCLLALLPLAVVGYRTEPNYNQLGDLGPEHASVIGAKTFQKYFAVGELGPTSVLIEDPAQSFRSDAGRDAIDTVSRQLAALPNVAEVRSVSQPLGKPGKRSRDKSVLERRLDSVIRPPIDARYVGVKPLNKTAPDQITRLDVVFKTEPFSAESLRSLDDVMRTVQAAIGPGLPLEGATAVGLTGPTAAVEDLRRVTTQDQRLMYVLVTGGVYAVLVLLLRRPGICLYLIVTVVIGYLASLGITELVFSWLHPGPEPWAGLDWKVGFFLFVILVAVGEDYNIFLMARVLEEERKHGVVEGTRRAVAHTGGIISSCGLIMAGTLGSMLTGSLTALRELGFALGLGVLLDTFLVRPILVPAFLVLLDRYRIRGVEPLRLPAWTRRRGKEPAPAGSLVAESLDR
jgi:RND superfamily putative drug exporter